MPNRIIKESICVSEQIDELTPLEEVTFYRLLVNCDDYGCFDAREMVVKSRLFPLRVFKHGEVMKLLHRLEEVGLIRLYEVEGKPFLMVCKWSEHQRVRISKHKYPMPTDDGLQKVAASCGELRRDSADSGKKRLESESESESESISESESKRKRFTPPTLDDVAAYCKEIAFDIDPQYFLDYQTARNWILSNGKQAKDWKAVLRTWKHNNFKRGKVVNAQQYAQRDYTGEQASIMSAHEAAMAEFLGSETG